MEFFDFGTIFFLVAAVVIFFQLRNVLGRRTGHERPPFDPYTAARNRDKGVRNSCATLSETRRTPSFGEDRSFIDSILSSF